ncbi:hypothetical protein SDRG_01904 [Saprolegnia diclina VS20]|uniref:Uncharacterized protein n=1 Tax=Saprolegnia diclina (strain VS20) TaxID=1156394 RepID=T0SD49_SAPDV|nr:hypothetical protein SDRG_01904 [Saprolegnia diclina VS20]EQC40837.1 hypothetical protein SDRG_01904 [Saprolegnia diclina VS20]|eukprot:XP_008605681.1 hypothetical protein SDRG_01904 [Saprolegnia diclina VS20]
MVAVVPIAPSGPSQPATSPAYNVTWNKMSLATSFLLLLNLLAMPMKAYLSEELPWSHMTRPDTPYLNLSSLDPAFLTLSQALFSRDTLASVPSFYDNTTLRTDIYRGLVDVRERAPVDRSDCIAFFYGVPGLVFYSPSFLDVLCSFAAVDHRKATLADEMTWQFRGACQYLTFFGLFVGQGCLWLSVGDDITMATPTPGVFTLTYTFQRPEYALWLWFKFAYRCGLLILVLVLTWRRYYRHCMELQRIVRAFGHVHPRSSDNDWHYELIVGDPTVLILMDPSVCAIFSIDVWLSVQYMGISMVRAAQTANLYSFFFGFLYYSRTVWFAYFALAGTSHALKRYRKEHLFANIDKTLVAIAVAASNVPLTYVQTHTSLVRVYMWLFASLPSPDPYHEVDVALGCILLSLIIASVPVLYGFAHRTYRARRKRQTPNARYTSQAFNGLKTRSVLCLVRGCGRRYPKNMLESGGSVYAAIQSDPRYAQHPTLSLRSVDCYLVCKKRQVPKQTVRLSLAQSLDRNLADPASAILDDETSDRATIFDRLEATPHPGPLRPTFKLQQGVVKSVWLA